ncbi:MAG: fused response regulator/phosphatase [Proteobacteria bacterium]|nr:fused response regulator/phosphatase [Pseudomonadota bacterium]
MEWKDDDMSILVVDDSRIVVRFASRVLSDMDLPIFTADNGRQALDRLREHAADLVITDLMMPEMDGFELISRLRADERFQDVHIIVLTALDQVTDKIRALELGANDYSVKPLEAGELRARVQAGIREIRLKKALKSALKALDNELRMVGRLQQRLLPRGLPQGERVRSAVFYRPCSRAGGDYYDLFTDDRGRLFFTIADVSGHGASAAVLMGMVRALLKVLTPEGESAARIVERLNGALLDNIGSDPEFVSFFLGLFHQDSMRLNFCSAGHGDMFLLGPGPGRVFRLPAGGTVLGFFQGAWEDAFLALEPGQCLVLYTDGLTEAVDSREREFGRDRLEKLLTGWDPSRDPAELVDFIRAEVEAYAGGVEFADDMTLFVIQFR